MFKMVCSVTGLLKLGALFVWLLQGTNGQWEEPPFLPLGEHSDIKIHPNLSVTIPENIGYENGFALFYMNLPENPLKPTYSPPFDGYFTIEQCIIENNDVRETRWCFNVTRPFDYETLGGNAQGFYTFIKDSVTATEQPIIVQVINVNEFPPDITVDPPIENLEPIDELQKPDELAKPILTVSAKDRDGSTNLTFNVKESGGQQNDLFFLNNLNQLMISRPLNYSQRTSHRVNITVCDNENPPKESFVVVTVVVRDVPNVPPEFIQTPTVTRVEESAPTDGVKPVASIKARDGDYGLNWDIKYSIIDDTGLDWFKIDEDTGEIFVAKDIDIENSAIDPSNPIYTFTVWASEVIPDGQTDLPESDTKSSHTVEVIIVDIDDQPPKFCDDGEPPSCNELSRDFKFSIDETLPSRSDIFLGENTVIQVVDLDSTPLYNLFQWSFDDGTDPIIQQAFTLIPEVGRADEKFSLLVKDVKALDFDSIGSIWRGPDGKPVERKFTILFSGKNKPEFIAKAEFTATVNDVNDNSPKFETTQYLFLVCENMAEGKQLEVLVPRLEDKYPNSCRSFQSTEQDIKVKAVDDDASPEFGTTSIIYRWSKGKQPMVNVTDEGKMIISSAENFDYERNAEETFYLDAYDMKGGEGSSFSTVPVVFKILDVNDEPVDVKFKIANRANVTEGDGVSIGDVVLTGIEFKDIDESAELEIDEIIIGDQFVRAHKFSGNEWDTVSLMHAEPECDELKEKMKKWFDVKMEGESPGLQTLSIIVGDERPDREGYGCEDVDRIDIIITVGDKNNETGDQSVTITVPITILDINDNPPESEGDPQVNVNLFETEDWNKTEEEPAYERLLFTQRVKDKDRNPTFTFSLSIHECKLAEKICNEILEMFEILPETSSQGETKLYRKNGAKIDRDDRTYFYNDNEDIIALVLSASDGREDHVASTLINIVIEDRNDNTPILCDNYNENYYNISELESQAIILETIQASDLDRKDKFGNVSYLLEDSPGNCDDSCACLNMASGDVVAVTKPNAYKWTMEHQSCTLQIEARDYYRSSSSSGSNSVKTSIVIHIEDQNDHPPDLPVPSIPYRVKENETLDATIQVQDLDNPALGNGDFTVNIIDVTGTPEGDSYFDLTVPPKGDEKNIKNVGFKTTVNMTGLCGEYNVTLEACDFWNYDNSNMAKCSRQLYVVEVANMNFNTPEFTYPVAEKETVPVHIEDVVIRQPIKTKNGTEMKNINANDKDKDCCCDNNKNGEVLYSITEFSEIDCSRLLDINEITGMIFFKDKPTQDNENLQCELILEATDQGEQPNKATAKITIVLLPQKNSSPYFGTASRVIEIVIVENKTEPEDGWKGSCEGDCGATDVDLKHGNYFEDQPEINFVYYSLRGGNYSLFEIEPRQTDKSDATLTIKPKVGKIDREMWGAVDGQYLFLNVSVYATNDPSDNPGSKDPQQITDADVQWAVISVKVDDIRDTPPSFKEKVIRAGFSTADKAEGEIGVIEAYDWDYNDSLNISISSPFEASEGLPNEGGTRPPFKLGNTQPVDRTNFFAQILVQFEPQPSHKGFYKFTVTATDSVAMSQTVECRIYAIADENILKFYFRNELDDLKPKFRRVAEIFSEAFNYPCNVDRAFIDAGVKEQGLVTLQTHFIDIDTDQPVAAEVIQAQQFDPDFYNNLTSTLKKEGLDLYKIGDSEDLKDTDFGQIITYVLIGAIAVLTITLLILSASCYYNNRSLGLQVRALTANTFGSQQSDLNRVGTMDAPNTNAFTAEGSNPVWATSPGGFEPRGIPDFDTDSVGSGGSVLIGAEDEDYFQSSLRNPAAFQANDVVANFDDESYNDNDGVSQGGSVNESPFATKVTNNPLMNFGGQGMSFDDDDNFGEEPFQFEGNSDANLF